MPRQKKAISVAAANRAQSPAGLYRFAALVVAGDPPDEAAKAVGSSLDDLAYAPELHAAMVAALHRRMAVDMAPKALATLGRLLETCNDERILLNVSKTILDYALPVGQPSYSGSASDKPMESLSTAELQAMVDRLEHELADRAKPVTQQDVAPGGSQAFDFME